MPTRRGVTMMHPDLVRKYDLFNIAMRKAGIRFKLTSVARTIQEQVALYLQGRGPLSTVNKYRKMAGLYLIKEAENKNRVTWTLQSRHLIDLEDSDEFNNLSRAFDIAIYTKTGKLTWDLKVDVNKNDVADYREAAIIGKNCGLTPGAFFKNSKGQPRPDYPHFQI